MQLSRLLAINLPRAGTHAIHSPANNVLYAIYSLIVHSTSSEQFTEMQPGDSESNQNQNSSLAQSLLQSLQSLATPQQQYANLPSLRKSCLNALRSLPESVRLQSQFKSIFPRFYMTFCTTELLSIYLDCIRGGDELLLELMNEITAVVPAVVMTSNVQLRFFALLHVLINSVANENVNGHDNDDNHNHNMNIEEEEEEEENESCPLRDPTRMILLVCRINHLLLNSHIIIFLLLFSSSVVFKIWQLDIAHGRMYSLTMILPLFGMIN